MRYELTDAELAQVAERIHGARQRFQGFTHGSSHWIRDLDLPTFPAEQVVWRGTDHGEMMAQIRFLKLRAALAPFRKE